MEKPALVVAAIIALAGTGAASAGLSSSAPVAARGGDSGSAARTASDPILGTWDLGPDSSIDVSPASATTAAGGSVVYTLSAQTIGGFSSSLTIGVAGLPTGTVFSYPAWNGTVAITVSTSQATPPGTYTLTFNATGGGIAHSSPVSLVVTPNSPQTSPTTTPPPLLGLGQILPAARSGQTYLLTLKAEGGTPPYHCVPQRLGVGTIAVTAACTIAGTAPVVRIKSVTGPFRFKVQDSSSPTKTSEFPSMNFTVIGPRTSEAPTPTLKPQTQAQAQAHTQTYAETDDHANGSEGLSLESVRHLPRHVERRIHQGRMHEHSS